MDHHCSKAEEHRHARSGRVRSPRARAATPDKTAPATAARGRGRPQAISNERLLDVAREVFLKHGFRATTSEVATRAGVAEGTIFRRFRSKDELFRAAMQFDPEGSLAWVESLPGHAGGGELRSLLIAFSEQFLAQCRVAVPVMMMSWSNPEGELRTDGKGEHYRRVLSAVRVFFEREAALGRLRAKDEPDVLARMLLGSLYHYCMTELLAPDVGGLTVTCFVEAVIGVILGDPRTSRRSGRARLPAEREA